MAGYVGRIEPGETLDAAEHFKGPWRNFRRITIDAGQERLFDAVDAEYSIFVMSGEGRGKFGGQSYPVNEGAAFTVGYRAALTLVAGDGPVEVFVTTLDVTP
jgi:hypothetical protein